MSIRRLLHISRPALWVYTAGAFAMGVGNVHNFHASAWLELFLFTFPFNFLLYGVNDIYDRHADRLNPRKGHNQGAILQETEVKTVMAVALIFAAVILFMAALSGSIEHFVIMALVVIAVFLYSHPKVRFKEILILDGIIGGGCYLLPVAVGYTLHSSISSIPPWILFMVLPMAGAHAVTTLMDIDSDRTAGLRTTGVRLGEKNTLLWALLTFIAGLVGLVKHGFLASMWGANLAMVLVTYVSLKRSDPNRFWFYFAMSAVFAVCWLMTIIYYFLLANRAGFGLTY
jgi:4-hydroxybenzoate polyprenyltransferase